MSIGNDTRWKYPVVRLKMAWTGKLPDEVLQAELDNQGARGWELVQVFRDGVGGPQLVFKRPA